MTNCTSEKILFPACRKRRVEADFDGGDVTSNGGVLLLRQADRLLGSTAAEALLVLRAGAVLVKSGHLAGAAVRDVLADAAGIEVFESPRIDTRHTHGTGCTLASAIATGLAQGLPLREAVVRARAYLQEALRRARSP